MAKKKEQHINDKELQEFHDRREADAGKTTAEDRARHFYNCSATEREHAWWEVCLNLKHWFSLDEVKPEEAAMLVCGFNPHEQSLDEALEFRPAGRPDLRMREIADQFGRVAVQECRRLCDWIQLAQKKSLTLHPWVQGHIIGDTADFQAQSRDDFYLHCYEIERNEADRLKRSSGKDRGARAAAQRTIQKSYKLTPDQARHALRRGKEVFSARNKRGSMAKSEPVDPLNDWLRKAKN